MSVLPPLSGRVPCIVSEQPRRRRGAAVESEHRPRRDLIGSKAVAIEASAVLSVMEAGRVSSSMPAGRQSSHARPGTSTLGAGTQDCATPHNRTQAVAPGRVAS